MSTSEDALRECTAALNQAMIDLNAFLSTNPTRSKPTDPEFRALKQRIKVLRLRQNEINEIRSNYLSDAMSRGLKMKM